MASILSRPQCVIEHQSVFITRDTVTRNYIQPAIENILYNLGSEPTKGAKRLALTGETLFTSVVGSHGTARPSHDDVIKWKHFPRYWPFVRGIHRSPVNFPHKGQWCGALIFFVIWAWMNIWVNNREAGDLRRHPVHCDVTVMWDLFQYLSDLMYYQKISQSLDPRNSVEGCLNNCFKVRHVARLDAR